MSEWLIGFLAAVAVTATGIWCAKILVWYFGL